MKIKRLEIVGFKSFVDKVSLDFGQGITGIVGPNGCGKSNIVDALRWVMGEQNVRLLRGKVSEDVIFGGSESRKPHGLAQVTLILDNREGLCPPAYKDFAEIMVTRCLHRDGESEYLINKTPCRLLDITELFMDTGVGARAYSIIEQGKVGMLVSAKPEDRRVLIEEVAGVTKYKARKKTALRKLDATKQNLVRLSDIIAEVRRQLGSLKRQAKQAEKYRQHRGEAKRIELSLSGNRFQELRQECATVAEQERQQAEVLARLDGRLEDGDLKLEEKQLQLGKAEAEQRQVQEQTYEIGAEIQRIEGELALARRQRNELGQQRKELQAELDRSLSQAEQLGQEHAKLVTLQEKAVAELAQLKADLSSNEEQLAVSRKAEQQSRQDFEDCRNQLLELSNNHGRLSHRRDEIKRRLDAEDGRRKQFEQDGDALQAQRQRIAKRRDALAQQRDQLASQRQQLAAETETASNLLHRRQAQLRELDAEANDLRQQLERAQTRQESLTDLQRNLEGYADGTRILLTGKPSGNGIAADFLRVPVAYETAVEMALGERLQAVAVNGPEDIAALLQRLVAGRARASLLSAGDSGAVVACPWGTPLLEQVEIRPGYEQQIGRLLAGVCLVDDVLQYQEKSLAAGLMLVDPQGRCLDWRGVLSGGATGLNESGLLRRQRQLEEVAVEIERLTEAAAVKQSEAGQLREQVAEVETEVKANQGRAHELELKALELEKDQQGAVAEEEQLRSRQELLNYNLNQLEEDRKSLIAEEQQLSLEIEGLAVQRENLEMTVGKLQTRLDEDRATLEQQRDQMTGQQVELASLEQQCRSRSETLERIRNQQKEAEQRSQRLRERLQQGQTTGEQLDAQERRQNMELEVLLDRRGELQQQVEQRRGAYDQLREELDRFRDQLRQVRAEAEELRKTVAQLQRRQHELKVDAEQVRQTALDRYRVDLLEHQVPEATAAELERQQQQLQRLQQQINGLGDVNLMAIDEYREQEQRYDFLCGQRDDLNQSMDDLHKAVNQINRTTRRRFRDTFELVNQQFQELFPRLFRGGQAELRLTDENDLLETGIDIIVQPPGKRLQNVNPLSGGEKALTSVALIFSLFLIKPTPFCILDEVDAPLDDANIDHFAELVREMTGRSQFVVITHSKRTMGVLDRMYGVTMQEPGVSKLVSVRLHERDHTPEYDAAASE
jgi:chromosome segregation protein